jgi:hypothetical protein
MITATVRINFAVKIQIGEQNRRSLQTCSGFCLVSALFAAVEHGYLDKARNILESTDVDVNRWVK